MVSVATGKNRTLEDNFGDFPKISSPWGRGGGKNYFHAFSCKMTNETYIHFVSKYIKCRY